MLQHGHQRWRHHDNLLVETPFDLGKRDPQVCASCDGDGVCACMAQELRTHRVNKRGALTRPKKLADAPHLPCKETQPPLGIKSVAAAEPAGAVATATVTVQQLETQEGQKREGQKVEGQMREGVKVEGQMREGHIRRWQRRVEESI